MRKKPLNRKHSSLCTLWFRRSREHIFAIRVEHVRRELDEVHYLSCVGMAKSSYPVVKLCLAACKSSDSKVGLCLSKPYMTFVSPELGELEGYSVKTETR